MEATGTKKGRVQRARQLFYDFKCTWLEINQEKSFSLEAFHPPLICFLRQHVFRFWNFVFIVEICFFPFKRQHPRQFPWIAPQDKLNIYLSPKRKWMAGVEKVEKSSSTLLSVPFHNSLFILLIVSVLLLFNNRISKGTQARREVEGARERSERSPLHFLGIQYRKKAKNCARAGKMLIGILTWITIKCRSHFRLQQNKGVLLMSSAVFWSRLLIVQTAKKLFISVLIMRWARRAWTRGAKSVFIGSGAGVWVAGDREKQENSGIKNWSEVIFHPPPYNLIITIFLP